MTEELAEVVLDGHAVSASAARRFVASFLASWGASHLADDAALVASELVTNTVLHAGTGARLVVRHAGGAVRIEVHDGSTNRPAAAEQGSASAMTGRGLRVVQELAARWGVDPTEDGKSTWAELGSPTVFGRAEAGI
ncbi:MAG TPA: ATP-binding protein, partial [Acidimicrobiales bacterium]